MTNKWTKEELSKLYSLKYKNKDTNERIAITLNKTVDAVRRKLARTNWDAFSKNPTDKREAPKKWGQAEMLQLDAFLQAGKSYSFIAEKLGRGTISVERKAQDTDWDAWRMIAMNTAVGQENIVEKDEKRLTIQNKLIEALIVLCRHDYNRLKEITQEELLRKINAEDLVLPCTFEELKEKTVEQLDVLGLGNPETLELGEGTYVIVGDSHGKHTKSRMFDLLKQVNKFLTPKKIIHLGHLLDDDNDISYLWGDFDNLVVLSKVEELKIVQGQRNKFNFHFDMVRGCVILGDNLSVMNQDMINDYVITAIKSLDSEIFDSQAIVNCHRLETISKCSIDNRTQYFASPGSLCERHIIKTIKQIDFTDDKTVKTAFYGGFSKYRKMEHMNKYWNQALIVVHVDKNGNNTIVPCPIYKIGNEYVTSYFDKIISSTGVHNPNKKILTVGDIHSPNHDEHVLDILEQISKDYNPNILVNLGDAHDFRTLNHHDIDKGRVIIGDVLKESAQTHHVLKRMTGWAKECHIIKGNHERFGNDFTDKFPQLESYLDFEFMCDLKGLGYKITDLKDILKIGSANFIHGELAFFGQPGSKTEKASRTIGHNTFVGHVHYPSIRFGAYSVGLCGKMDQGYNEINASTWIHGFGLCNQYKGVSWLTTLAVVGNQCHINGKIYKPKNPKSWKISNYKAKLVYTTN